MTWRIAKHIVRWNVKNSFRDLEIFLVPIFVHVLVWRREVSGQQLISIIYFLKNAQACTCIAYVRTYIHTQSAYFQASTAEKVTQNFLSLSHTHIQRLTAAAWLIHFPFRRLSSNLNLNEERRKKKISDILLSSFSISHQLHLNADKYRKIEKYRKGDLFFPCLCAPTFLVLSSFFLPLPYSQLLSAPNSVDLLLWSTGEYISLNIFLYFPPSYLFSARRHACLYFHCSLSCFIRIRECVIIVIIGDKVT